MKVLILILLFSVCLLAQDETHLILVYPDMAENDRLNVRTYIANAFSDNETLKDVQLKRIVLREMAEKHREKTTAVSFFVEVIGRLKQDVLLNALSGDSRRVLIMELPRPEKVSP